MSETPATSPFGKALWLDLTVDNAVQTRDFYAAVLGWTSEPVPVEDHEDYVMKTASGEAAAGICHRLGPNAGIPATWVPYFVVEDVVATLEKALGLGASQVAGSLEMGFVLLKDPGGVVFAISKVFASEGAPEG